MIDYFILQEYSISDNYYAEIAVFNGSIMTFVYKRISEPNVFKCVAQGHGAHLEMILKMLVERANRENSKN